MGTRGVIAKPDGDGWRGRYHHWDSYPSGLGAALLRAHEDLGSTDEMVRVLIDEELVGWSTICGKDLRQPKGWHDSHDRDAVCAACTLPMWRHYRQYYPEGGPNDPMVNGTRRAGLIDPDQVIQLGHTFEHGPAPTNPQSYSARGETTDQPDGRWITSHDEDAAGTEWAYVITPRGLMVWEGDLGMFGCGGGNFLCRGLVEWGDWAGMLAIEMAEADA